VIVGAECSVSIHAAMARTGRGIGAKYLPEDAVDLVLPRIKHQADKSGNDTKLPINIFFINFLKVLQRAPLKNTSELKQRSKQENRTLIAVLN
jgi:hypothetical protein